jgi:hypothetical protein
MTRADRFPIQSKLLPNPCSAGRELQVKVEESGSLVVAVAR